MVARYLASGRKAWKVLPTSSDPPEMIEASGAGCLNGVGGNEAFLYCSYPGGITSGGGFIG